jgi:lipopolysaccharide export system ATP-binding protein
VVGLLGPNGAGKTTSFYMIVGLLRPDGGRIFLEGEDVTELPMYKRCRLGMGYLPQESSVFRKLTVEENLLAILETLDLSHHERMTRLGELLAELDLTRLARHKAFTLSGGERRRLEITRALVTNPRYLLLDEPFTGIDPKTIADIQEIVRQLRRQGIGILLTDHNVREALKITDRSYLIKDGKVRTHGTPQEIIHDPIAISEYLGAGFNDNTLSGPPPKQAEKSAEPGVHLVLEQEKIRRLVESLKTKDRAAVAELTKRGPAAVPALLEALERRDVELRNEAYQVLQGILKGAATFDPYAPEAHRRQQIADLREKFERKAG